MPVSNEALTTLHDLLAINLGTMRGNRLLLDKIVSLLDFSGFRIVEQMASFSGVDHVNLVGSCGPNVPGGLLMTSAIDTAGSTNNMRWTCTEEDPFNPTEQDGFLYAHGATSGKVDFVCQVIAATNLASRKLRFPVTVAALVGEQARVAGAMQLLDSGMCQPQWAVVGEPTNLELVTAHRGYLALQFDFFCTQEVAPSVGGKTYSVLCHGERAHSATPYMGRNAVQLMLKHIERFTTEEPSCTIHQLKGGHRLDEVPDECSALIHVPAASQWMPLGDYLEIVPVATPVTMGPDIRKALLHLAAAMPQIHELFRWSSSDNSTEFYPSNPIYNLSGIRTEENGTVQLVMDYRPLPGQRCDALVRDVEHVLRHTKLNSDSPIPMVQILQNRLAMDASDDSPLVRESKKVLRNLNIPAVTSTHVECTEGWIFSAAGIDTVVFGPGPALGVKRQANEYTILSHVEAAVRFYEQIIWNMCGEL